MTAAPVLMRPVRPEDATALVQLATLLDTMNLPRDPAGTGSVGWEYVFPSQ